MGATQSWPGAFRQGSEIIAEWASLHAGDANGDVVLLLVTWVLPLAEAQLAGLFEGLARILSDQGLGEVATCWGQLGAAVPTDEEVSDIVRATVENSNLPTMRKLYIELDSDLNRNSLFLLAHASQPPMEPWLADSTVENSWPFRGVTYPGQTPPLLTLSPVRPANRYELAESERDQLRESWNQALGSLPGFRAWTKAYPALLWCGDAPTDVLQKVLEDAVDELTVRLMATTFWQVPHHGSTHSFLPDFYTRIGVAEGFVCCGSDNGYRHPSPKVLRSTSARVVTESSGPFCAFIKWR